MAIAKQFRPASEPAPNYVEVAATLMPKRMIGLKQMLRPACRYLPVPLTLGWQENPIDDDYPQNLLVKGLQLTDIQSGATRTVNAPWMHALYNMTYEERPSGVMEVKLREAQFSRAFTWQHRAILCILAIQGVLGLSAIAHGQSREGGLIILGIILQVMEGYFASKFPSHRPPRPVATARDYVLHKGMTTTHFLLIFLDPKLRELSRGRPFVNLEDVAVPMPIIRRGYRRLFENTFRLSLQLASIGLKLGCILSRANGLLIPLTLLFGTVASEIIMMIHTPLPKISSMEFLELPRENTTLLDMVAAICQRTGSASVGFVEAVLPDREGNHVDFDWITRLLATDNPLVVGPHPSHQTANNVFSTVIRRGTNTRT